MTRSRKIGPLDAPLPSEPCAACRVAFRLGDYATLIPLGPGPDTDEQELAREGRSYNAVAVMVHWACATGEL